MKFRGAVQHHLVSPIRFANGGTYWHDIPPASPERERWRAGPTTIPTTKSRDMTKAVALCGRGKAVHFVLPGTIYYLTIVKKNLTPFSLRSENSQPRPTLPILGKGIPSHPRYHRDKTILILFRPRSRICKIFYLP